MIAAKRFFTLLEVIVSLAILAISLAVLLQLLTNSQKRLSVAEERWKNMHMLMQGAEYLLLHNQETSFVPERFFPYSGYNIEVSYEDIDNLPDEYSGIDNQTDIQACVIELVRQSDGKVIEKAIIDRLLYEESLSPEE